MPCFGQESTCINAAHLTRALTRHTSHVAYPVPHADYMHPLLRPGGVNIWYTLQWQSVALQWQLVHIAMAIWFPVQRHLIQHAMAIGTHCNGNRCTLQTHVNHHM